MPLFGGFAPPLGSFDKIFGNTIAVGITIAEVILCACDSNFSDFSVILDGFGAFLFQQLQYLNSRFMPLFGGFAEPFDCFSGIFGYTIAVHIANAEIKLCSGVPLFGSFAESFDGFYGAF